MTIRPATPADEAAIVAVFLGCWRDNYGPLFGAKFAAAFDLASATTLWHAALATDQVLVADDGKLGVVGVVRLAQCSQCFEIGSLYVSPAVQGRGLGKHLLNAAIQLCGDPPVAPVTLWVFARNTPSLAFYQRLGWSPAGMTRVESKFGEQEVQLAWPNPR